MSLAIVALTYDSRAAPAVGQGETESAFVTGDDLAAAVSHAAVPPHSVEVAQLFSTESAAQAEVAQTTQAPASGSAVQQSLSGSQSPTEPPSQSGGTLQQPVSSPGSHVGSSTPPEILHLVREEAASATIVESVSPPAESRGDEATSALIVFVPAAEGLVQVIVGSGSGATVDFSSLDARILARATTAHSATPAEVFDATGEDSPPAGVFVDLSANGISAASAVGEVTVQAWLLDDTGLAAGPLAHLVSIDNVIGTVGSDILAGNGAANVFTYTAHSLSQGTGASYGFDIDFGGGYPETSSGTGQPEYRSAQADNADTADFSRLAVAADIGASTAETLPTLLPAGTLGITVDLAAASALTFTDPLSGIDVEVTGSLVIAYGSDRTVSLALLAWDGAASGDAGSDAPASSIENVVGSSGADVLLGNAADNVFSYVGDGTAGLSLYDGRDGKDTADFSRVDASDILGIVVRLGSASEALADALGAEHGDVATAAAIIEDGTTRDLVQLSSIERIVGSRNSDLFAGSSGDDVLTGGGGADTFYFVDFTMANGQVVANIGNDEITDFSAARGDSSDRIVLGREFVILHAESVEHGSADAPHDERLFSFFRQFMQQWDDRLVLRFGETSSITLDNVKAQDLRFAELDVDRDRHDNGAFFHF